MFCNPTVDSSNQQVSKCNHQALYLHKLSSSIPEVKKSSLQIGILEQVQIFLFLFTYCMKIFLYYKYNKNFRLSLLDLFNLSP